MRLKKYLKAIIISVLSIVVLTVMSFQGPLMESSGISTILPGDTASAQYFYTFTFMWIGPIIGSLFGYLLAPLFLIVHKKTIGRKMSYGIEDIRDPNPDKFKGLSKGLFPALMALNIALIVAVTPWGSSLLTEPTYNIEDTILIIMIMLAIAPAIGVALFSPVWFLIDSGLVYSNQQKVEKKPVPLEVRSVGGWYLYILKGYAGISVILSFYTVINEFIAEGKVFGDFFVQMLLPILITLFIIPTIVILDVTREKRRKYVLMWAKKFKIIDNVKVTFEVI